jgi:hypothetical protein
MSKIALSGNALGTGTFTIASPDSSTDRTLTLPDNSGTVLTNATTTGFPAGSVLQVVSVTTTSEITTTSASFVTTGFTATITPTSASSKILIFCGSIARQSTTGFCIYTIYRGDVSTGVDIGNTSDNRGLTGVNGVIRVPLFMSVIDSPSTTSSTTYTVAFRAVSGTGYFGENEPLSTLTLMEIAA